jgi:Protein of unknown function (DUF2809)
VPATLRKRLLLTLWLLVVVAAGLGSRSPGMPAFVLLYLGDVLWGVLFFLLGAWCWPEATLLRVWGTSTLVTELIEVSQLYQAPWAQAVRATRLGGLLLGHAFLWSDVVCVATGTSLAALISRAFRVAEATPSAR